MSDSCPSSPGSARSRVLIAVDQFPAEGGSRADKFVKLLPRIGIEPVVISPRETKTPRAVALERALYPSGLESYTARSIGFSCMTERFLGRGPSAKHYGLLKVLSWPERALFVPDHMVRWIPHGIRIATNIALTKGVTAILTISPSESTHLIGLALKRRLGLRWVADFTDLWSQKKLVYRPATAMHDWYIRRLERRVLTTADHVIANTAENREMYVSSFGLPREHVSVIPCGFDREDVGTAKQRDTTRDCFRIGYMGHLSKHDFPWKAFLNALRMLAEEVGGDHVRFVHCGFHSRDVQDYVAQLGIQHLVVQHGFLSHGEAMRITAATDLRLVLLYENEYSGCIVPGKLYNYLIMDGPILAIAPEQGATARLIAETRSGVVVSPTRGVAAILALLRRFYDQWKRGEPHTPFNQERVAEYDIRWQVAQLARLLQPEFV